MSTSEDAGPSGSVPSAGSVFSSPVLFLAFGFGSGLAPRAPGTVGTLAAIPVYWIMAQFPLWIYLALVFVAAIAGIYICGRAAERLGVHDHGGIVWDEFVGYWLAMTALPATLPWILAGFVLFRIFDIAKPWPIRLLDRRIRGGLGIMADDWVAGLFAWAILFTFHYYYPY